MRNGGAALFGALVVAALSVTPVAKLWADTGEAGAWNERVQIFHDASKRSVFRLAVRVWDAEPAKGLDFLWEPDQGSPLEVGADGKLGGHGTLTWRVRGSASYDPGAVHSVYTGRMRDGRPNGEGRWERRSGESYEGFWRDGVLDGPGIHVDAAGNRYEGQFRHGKPDGKGRHLAVNGEIFDGDFAGGLRHGTGTTILPGGTRYVSTWAMGVETSKRPSLLADADGGGLMRIQTSQDAAARTEFTVTVDQRMNQLSETRYQHLMRAEDIAIYPLSVQVNAAWNGNGDISEDALVFMAAAEDTSPVFLESRLATTDNSRVRLDGVQIEVAGSETYLKPMLSLQQHFGCVGFRPSFSFVNHGWGEVEDARATIRFTGERSYEADPPPQPETRPFEVPVGGFDLGIDVSVRNALIEAGVDVTALETKRFPCPSDDQLGICRGQVFNNVDFGEIAGLVFGEDMIATRAVGELSYRWADVGGTRYDVTEPFSVDINLAQIEIDRSMAECGDAFGLSPEALRYIEVELPLDQSNYAIDLPVRGNRNVRDYTARLKMFAEKSSVHRFQTAARFEDGSVRRSKPVTLFYFRPRENFYAPTMRLPACYLSGGGC
ncbi:hypothetical protein EJC49_11410 [Aquibium carbonis]|uniref:MORN repeat-containing protein n=1 Tax=Aquibium carbonis TaxID=2495581 RepID=A0A429YXX9_9HYPH|nr:hypothetical protein [Aquibium carbonis]RST86301.1 hypothetical protein EJC49_11410 [Aquibium carbonis]